MRIDHIALYCNDLEGMRDFFVTHFDARIASNYHNPRTQLRTCFLSMTEGSTRLELMTRPGMSDAPAGKWQLGYTHLALALGSRQQVDSLTARLAAAGYATLNGPRITGDGYYEAVVQGPEGIELELVE